MRLLRGLALAAALAWALSPEIHLPDILRWRDVRYLLDPDVRGVSRYRAERQLAVVTPALRSILVRPGEVADPQGALDRITRLALSAAEGLPGDSRAWIVAGSARLVAGDPERALAFYRNARAEGERAEIDLSIGRAYENLGQTEKANAAMLRAVWISPALFPTILPDSVRALVPQFHRLEADLRAGRLKAAPPLPE